MEEYAREPCPWRIVDDCGGAFTMGTIGGGIFQAFKGFRNSPVVSELRGSLTAIKTRAPQLGGPWRPEESFRSPAAGLAGSCELMDVGAGTELKSSARAASTFHH
uniref:Translocase of inner mitochondrial membrane 17A n=1 Tax=Rattus norvegicus TaxID=10116 RepID=A0A8L2Q460_RAT